MENEKLLNQEIPADQVAEVTENALKQQELMQQETTANPTETQHPPEVQAAMYLHGALPAFRAQLEMVTGTQCKRVLSALMESPLEKTVPGFTTKQAEDLFIMGLNISSAKFILFTTALKDKDLAASSEADAIAAGTEAANNETKGEEVNG